MTMLEEIYEAARQAAPSGTDETLLRRLCEISAAQWESRLKDGMTAEDCRTVFVCAAAWMAVVGIYAQKSVTGWNIESFTGSEWRLRALRRVRRSGRCRKFRGFLSVTPEDMDRSLKTADAFYIWRRRGRRC